MNKKLVIVLFIVVIVAIGLAVFLVPKRYCLLERSTVNKKIFGQWWSAKSPEGEEIKFCCPLGARCVEK